MLKILYPLLIATYVFYLPGYLIIKAGSKKTNHLSTHVLAFGLGIILIPISSFGVALLLHTTVQNNLILTIATLVNLVCLIAVSKRKPKVCSS